MKKPVKIALYVVALLILASVAVATCYNAFPWGEPTWSRVSPDGRFRLSGYTQFSVRMFVPTMPGQGGFRNRPGTVVLSDNTTNQVIERQHLNTLGAAEEDNIRWLEDCVLAGSGALFYYPKKYLKASSAK